MYEKGYIYKGKKPVYWCPKDETALAEAEIEYANDKCESIYVKFKVHDDRGRLSRYCDLDELYFVIWTTTTWTIPGNLAICLNADLDYVLARQPNGEVYILAKERLDYVKKAANIESFEILAEMKGAEFEFMTARHPLFDRDSLVILGDHVTLDAGTGCVHTAPGHGIHLESVAEAHLLRGHMRAVSKLLVDELTCQHCVGGQIRIVRGEVVVFAGVDDDARIGVNEAGEELVDHRTLHGAGSGHENLLHTITSQ